MPTKLVMSSEVDETIRKAQQLEPNDPVRRGLLEIVADLILNKKKSRQTHNLKRLHSKAGLLKY